MFSTDEPRSIPVNARDYFNKPTPAWKTHPLFRYWQGVKADPSVADVRMELYRPREGLVYRPADIYLHVKRVDGRQDPPQKIDWEDVVNEGLLHLQVRAVDADNEAQRFALWLQSMFASVEGHFSESFFSAVLPEVVAEGPFANGSSVSRMLGRIRRQRTLHEKAWQECREMIDNVLAGRWEELTSADLLNYSDPEADPILEKALALYLDEYFNISNRDLLGWQ
jgi:hypothetical protein